MDILNILGFVATFIILAGIYSIFSMGLNIHWGFTGLFNIGIAGFFAIGAYSSALIIIAPPDPAQFEDFKFAGNLAHYISLGDLWLLFAIITGALAAALLAIPIGLLTIKLREDYLAMATLGIAETTRLIFLNEKWLANGSKGLYKIPKFLGELIHPQYYEYFYMIIIIIFIILIYLLIEKLTKSPWGRVLRAIRDDELVAAASGKNVSYIRLQSFVLGAAIMGIGGALYTYYIRFLSPFTFDPLLATFVIWAMLMIGGKGNNKGAILGAFLVWGIWSFSQFLTKIPIISIMGTSEFRLFMIGILIIVAIVFKPLGILPERTHNNSKF